jgi:putative heme-binding domain-containing protein
MRTLALSGFALALCTLAGAQDTFTQKPTTERAVDRGEPAPAPKVDAGAAEWDKRFESGPTPQWIWGDTPTKNYTLRTSFVANNVKAAKLKVSADNAVVLFLNGKQVAASDEWKDGAEADVTAHLKGNNEIVAEVRNDGGVAAFVFKLVLVDDNGKVSHVVSDTKWFAAPNKNADGVPAKKIATYGDAPWGKVLEASAAQPGAKVPANTFVTLPGFKVEKLFSVPKATLGSWVNICADDKGRLIASDQGNLGLVRITPGKVGTDEETKVEKIPAKLSGAQGLLWHNNGLYVVVNGSGLYRVTSSNNDDKLDKVEKLKAINGGGEHGTHAVRLGPDGKSLYVVAGNFTKVPDGAGSVVPPKQGEDHLLPRQWDSNGHAAGILAPGGWVARTDLEGKKWEVFSSGYRNAYDFAFNADGEMFVYDSDMEWDMGAPWYRPTRVSHTVSGGDYGWRSGTGVWPNYYLDSLPAMIDIGPGSPVGVEFGYGAKFPAKYQKALFICDWTFGTMYALHIEPNGATYKATKEEFLSRTPLPLTDVCINPADGAMYFTIGGRGANSELFRVTYVGTESTAKVDAATPPSAERKLLKQIQEYHKPSAHFGKAVEFLLPLLAHKDRFVRHSARVALEHQPVKVWQDKVLASEDADAVIGGVVALARQGDKALQPKLIEKLGTLDFAKLDERQQLDVLRAYHVVFTRTGEPADKGTAPALVKALDPVFPHKSDAVNRELAQLLIYLKSPTIVEKVTAELKKPSKPLTQEGLDELLLRNRGYGGSIANMLKNAADQQKLSYLFALRNATTGWTVERWQVYYAFLKEAQTKSGGNSYQKFLINIEKDAFANASDNERLAIEALKLRPAYKAPVLPKPLGPGRAWATADVVALEAKLAKGRDFKNGQRAYAAARCVVCHRMGGEGGATGPDLSQVAGRFGLKELAEAIVEPSKVISDQYAASIIIPVAGKQIIGKVVSETNGKLTVVVDPEDSSKITEIKLTDIEERRVSKVSLMPEKLLNDLNENEVLDMLAYMLSRGDPNHAMFKK